MYGTVTTVGENGNHSVFSDKRDAEETVAKLRMFAEWGENFDLRDYPEGGWHIEISYRGHSEGFH